MSVKPSDLPVAILAGGLATRLRPLTETIPKSLIEVAGRPFLSHQLEQLASQGLKNVVLCVGHLGEMIEEDYGDGSGFGIDLQYSFDGPTLLGTGGALRRALPKLGDAFYVLYGDSFLPVDFKNVGRAFLNSGRKGLMTVYQNEGLYDASNVWFENGKIRNYDKKVKLPEMHYIDYGLSLFKAEAFSAIGPEDRVDLAEIMQDLLAAGELEGFEIHERFYEIGSHAGLAELNALLARK